MRRTVIGLIIMSVLLSFAPLFGLEKQSIPERSPEFWDMYSKNLVRCLKEGNEGIKYAALQRIVSYGEKLDVNDAVFEIMRIYRNDKNPKARQLALSALNKMNNEWAIGFLKLHVKHEENPQLKRQIYAMIKKHDEQKG